MTDPEEQMTNIPKCEHLFLLIGTNPLPNYVSVKLLASDRSKLYLVHSAETGKIAKRLQDTINKNNIAQNFEFQLIEVKESDAGDIYGKVKSAASNISTGQVVLNYTGGTKMMSVHAHRAVQDACEKNHITPYLSYLDAGTLSLIFEASGPTPPQSIPVDISIKIKLEDELLALHGYSLQKSPNKEDPWLPLAKEIAKIFQTPEWKDWLWRQLRRNVREYLSDIAGMIERMKSEACETNRQNILNEIWKKIPDAFEDPTKKKKDPQLKNIQIKPPNVPVLSSVCSKLKQMLIKIDKNDMKSFLGWLDGRWLESYTLDAVSQAASSCDVHEFRSDLEVKEPTGEKTKFQFDVAALRGYQLFAISCTTDDSKSMCKLKLFEAYIRARQLGGAEAKVALVCYCKYTQSLQSALTESWEAEGKIRVFGPDDLPNLSDKLKNWFNQN